MYGTELKNFQTAVRWHYNSSASSKLLLLQEHYGLVVKALTYQDLWKAVAAVRD
jgi:hypothetical protein